MNDSERSAGDLATFLGLRGSTVSQHLSLLRRDGQTNWYSIASPPACHVLETLFEIFCKPTSMCEPPTRQQNPKASARTPGKEQR